MIARISFVVALSVASAGAAWAGNCVALHKELTQSGAAIQQLQKDREDAVVRFDTAGEARYNAQSDLNMVKAGASKADPSVLVERIAKYNEQAQTEKAKIEELNQKLVTLAETRKSVAATFNKKCVN